MSVKRRATLSVEELEHRVLLDGVPVEVPEPLPPSLPSLNESEPNDGFDTADSEKDSGIVDPTGQSDIGHGQDNAKVPDTFVSPSES